jgi:hypothetical protein
MKHTLNNTTVSMQHAPNSPGIAIHLWVGTTLYHASAYVRGNEINVWINVGGKESHKLVFPDMHTALRCCSGLMIRIGNKKLMREHKAKIAKLLVSEQ